MRADPRIAVVGIAGPGDPFANADATLETLRLVRRRYPEMLLCVASNGLGVPPYVDELAELDVSHVTITVNAVDPAIGAADLRLGPRRQAHLSRARPRPNCSWSGKLEAIRRLKPHGITVKINTIIIPGVNDDHVPEVARTMAELGADIINCVPLYPVAGTPFGTTFRAFGRDGGGRSAQAAADSCRSWPTAPAAGPMPWGCWANRCRRAAD